MIEITIELYGAFRQYTKQEELSLTVTSGTDLPGLRRKLQDVLQGLNPQVSARAIEGLVEASAFADENSILPATSRFEQSAKIAALPPVCGG